MQDRQTETAADNVKPPSYEAGASAPRPWSMQWSETFTNNGYGHVYIVDATGRKIAAIWGKADEKMGTAELIVELVNRHGQ